MLRGHLEVILLERVGEAEIRERYLRAARLLQAAGALAEALEAYCRAGDWEATARLLGHEGEQLAQDPGQWLDLLTPQLRRDPWVLLATARRHRNAGRWAAALEAYREAGDALGEGLRGEASRRERMWLETLVGAEPAPAPGRSAVLRSATRAPHRALVTARAMGGGGARLAQGLAALFGGRLGEARSALAAALDEADAGPGVLAAASLGLAVTRLLAGDAGARPSLESAIEEADGAALPWLARIGRAAFALTDRPDGRSEAASVLLAAERDGDGWGVGLAGLLGGLGRLRLGEAHDESLRRAAEAFRRMDAPALEAWALGALALALARRRDPGAAAAADGAEILARATGARPALALAYLALAAAAPGRAAPRLGEAARAIAAESGFELPEPGGRSEEPDAAAPPASSLRCFGGLRLVLLGRELDLRALKPRVRELLRILGLHAGRPVHREVLIEALWPEVDPDTGTRNLHVAVSALRHLTDLPGTASTQSVVVREGDAYRLGLPTGAVVDLTTFEAAVSAGRRARTSGDGDAAEAAFRQALDLHAGDLLPEAGPATWVVAERERYRAEAVEAASSLAAILLERADPEEAAAACERGLRVDRYQDRLWRLLVRAHEASGSLAAAVAARTRYREVLEALGVPATGTLTRTTS